MNVPVVLSVARIHIDATGALAATLDGEPYAADRDLHRGDLQGVLANITAHVKAPVRVEVTEADGTTYCDIATPADQPSEADSAETTTEPANSGIHGAGFRPGERVAVAYVLAHETAADDGSAELRLPAAALARRRGALVLFGLDSRVATLLEEPA
jgi:hypothetical protein